MGLIRFFLAASIIFGHIPISNYLFLGAPMALHLFFMISGYSISHVLEKKYLGRKNGINEYTISRIVRIYPMYLIILAVSIAFGLFEIWRGYSTNGAYLFIEYGNHIRLLVSAIVTNFIIVGQDLAMFVSYNPNSYHFFWTNNFISESFRLDRFLYLPQAWALALELYFYMLAPWLVRKSSKTLITLALLSFFLRVFFTIRGFPFDPWSYRFFPTELLFFLLGVLAYRSQLFLCRLYNRLNMNVIFLFLLICIVFFRSLPYIQFYGYQLSELLFYPIFFFFMPYAFKKEQVSSWQKILGGLSYPMYLTHLLVGVVVLRLRLPYQYYGLVSLIVTIVVSYVLYRCITPYVSELKMWLSSVNIGKHRRID